ASVAFQRSPAGAGTWTTVSTDTASPFSASLDTTALADGLYDLRLVATDGAGNSTVSAVVHSRRVDNTKPSLTLANPCSPGRATVTLSATASDGGSGLAGVDYQYSPAGQAAWVTTPSAWNTAALADGHYDVRAVATDNAGNARIDVISDIDVDNTAPTVTLA